MVTPEPVDFSHWWTRLPGIFVLRFVGLSLIFLGGHFLFELTSIGKNFKAFESELLQTMLDIEHNPDFVPIIINISPSRGPASTTDRALLDSLITKLDSLQVSAIGIDIDFSPLDNGEPVTPADWTYFEKWAKLTPTEERTADSETVANQPPGEPLREVGPANKGSAAKKAADEGTKLKLRLGVYRRATDRPPQWLGRPKFAELAAGIERPANDSEHNFAYVRTSNKEELQLLPMAVALYKDVSQNQDIPGNLVSKDSEKGLFTARYRVDYSESMIKLLADQTIDYDDLDKTAANGKLSFRGKVVLIGDATGFEDRFCRPFSSMPTAGVIAHAASLATLRQKGLWEVEGEDTAWLDAATVAFGCLLLSVFYLRRGRSRESNDHAASQAADAKQSPEQIPSDEMIESEDGTAPASVAAPDVMREQLDRLETLYCILSALMIGLVGLFIVRVYRIFWPDFLWAAASLFIHPFVSETFLPFFGGLASEIGRMLKRAFPDPAGGPHAL